MGGDWPSDFRLTRTVGNAWIPLHRFAAHADYLASLSKNARQNLRTAYNRLGRDGHTCGLRMAAHPNRRELGEVMRIYERRHAERYGVSSGWLRSMYLRHINYSTRSLTHCAEGLTAMLMIDGRVAAFMAGYLRDGRYIVPRLSVSDDFLFYSPGILLIDQVAQWMIGRGHSVLDLAQGDEKYKYKMGAERHDSHCFVL